MVQIIISEITGSGQVVGPDVTNQFIASGIDSGDNILVNATGEIVNVGVTVIDSGYNVNVSGQVLTDDIAVNILEAIYPTGDTGPYSTRFYYNDDDQLILKSANSIDTSFTYNLDGTLYQISNPSYTKTFLYDSNGLLTGFNVT